MAHQIRRDSMKHLQLYDLDKLTLILPPPLPTTPKHQYQRSTFERYQFLCDMKRCKTDPVYAATPMFTTIPQSKHIIKHPRQILGAYVPRGIIKPLSTTSPKSPEPESTRTDDDEKEEHKSSDEDDDDDQNLDDDNDERDESSRSSSSSSSSSDNNDNNDILNDDDDDKKGIVEQIFNRDKK